MTRGIILIFFICSSTFFKSQNNSLSLDGSNDHIKVNPHNDFNFDFKNPFSVEGWIKTSLSTNHQIIFSKMANSAPFRGYDITLQGGYLYLTLINTYPSNCIKIAATNFVADGNWHHFATVYDGVPNAANVKIYIDGIQASTGIDYNSLSATIVNTEPVFIGARNGQIYFFDGEIDELRVWNKALCAAEITARKNCQLSGTETNLVAYYNFNQGTAGGNNTSLTSLTDFGPAAHTGTIMNMTMTGSTSNFVTSTNGVNGTCPVFGNLSVSGNTLMCAGASQTLTAGGANTYTWSSGATGATISISPSVTTSYTIEATTSANCMLSTIYTQSVMNCAGLNANKIEKIIFYPNPAGKILRVKDLAEKVLVDIFNTMGEKVLSAEIEPENPTINISSFAEGIYFIVINENITYKLIIGN